MRRKFIAAVTSGVLALTVMAALPTHAEAVSIWLDLTPGTESVETFQYKDYADRYSDAYELYGDDAEALFNHYETTRSSNHATRAAASLPGNKPCTRSGSIIESPMV